ncbi:MAG: GNAT family N-acetyltransferase [Planctomycetes bacterium]|nr:GNAT family N-acetyltransferase [Planctomycetota bacterium]
MTVTQSKVFLHDRAANQLVEATLYDTVLERHLQDFERAWKGFSPTAQLEHEHWDWRKKVVAISGQLGYQSFAVECGGETQGLMVINTIKRGRLPQQAGQHLVYVEYVQAAPWNRPGISGRASYRGVGTVLIAAAIQQSVDEGYRGRIGLHSLPQADAFYRDACGMTDLGSDSSYSRVPLRYFEMSEDQAGVFLKQGR